jgi:hypothetical protein
LLGSHGQLGARVIKASDPAEPQLHIGPHSIGVLLELSYAGPVLLDPGTPRDAIVFS